MCVCVCVCVRARACVCVCVCVCVLNNACHSLTQQKQERQNVWTILSALLTGVSSWRDANQVTMGLPSTVTKGKNSQLSRSASLTSLVTSHYFRAQHRNSSVASISRAINCRRVRMCARIQTWCLPPRNSFPTTPLPTVIFEHTSLQIN